MKIHLAKRICLSFSICLLSTSIHAQNLNLEWAKSMGGIGNDDSRSITVDDSGNVYTTGAFHGTVDFDPGLSSYYISSKGNMDIFIQKLDYNGDFLWAKGFGSVDRDWGSSITLDTVDDIYITGGFRDTVEFDPGRPAYTLVSGGYSDVFTLKLDGQGNVKWVKSLTSSGEANGHSIVAKGSDNVYVVGDFRDTLYPIPGNPYKYLVSGKFTSSFAIKYDGGGNLLWAKSWAGTQGTNTSAVSVGKKGSTYIVGSFGVTCDFDPDTTVYTLAANGGSDMFLLSLDASGNFRWAKAWGGTSYEDVLSLTIDEIGNIYTTGSFTSTIDLDPDFGSTFSIPSVGQFDIYIQKLDSMGNFLWGKSIGSSVNESSRCITSDALGNLYLTGSYKAKLDFDPDPGTYYMTPKGAGDIYVLKLDTAGSFKWVKSMGGTYHDWGISITTDTNRNVIVTGGYQTTADFDPDSGIYNLSSNGTWDIFVMKLGKCGINTRTDVITACDSYAWIDGITYTQNDSTASVTFTNGLGCDSTVNLYLIINTVDVSLTNNDPSIAANATNATYQWLNCDNNYPILIGGTSKTFTATSNGRYAVIVTQNGCTDTSDCINISSIGIEENALFNDVHIYPNPNNGMVNIDLGDLKEISVRIFSLSNQLIYEEENISNSTHQFEFKAAPGFYIIELSTQGLKQQYKLVRK